MKFAACLVMVIFAWQAHAARADQGQSPVGRLSAVAGSAGVWRKAGGAPVSTAQAPVYEGDQLTTGAGGRISLLLRDGSTLSLGPDSGLRIVGHDSRQSVFELTGGLLRAQIARTSPPGSRLEIRARYATCWVTGGSAAAFGVDVRSPGATRVANLGGAVVHVLKTGSSEIADLGPGKVLDAWASQGQGATRTAADDNAGGSTEADTREFSRTASDARLALIYGAELYKQQKYEEARQALSRASTLDPNSAQIWKFLGSAEYYSDHAADAVRSWKKSLALAPDEQVKGMLARAERELDAQADHDLDGSEHFRLKYEGKRIFSGFRREILQELERDYTRLERDLGVSLREPVTVTLYTERAYYEVTEAPAWSGGENDGRISFGVDGLTSVNSLFSAALMHELTHSFVAAKSGGRCPAWANEGLAQLMEGRSAKGDPGLANFWSQGKQLPLKSLERGFGRFGDRQTAVLAYAEGLATVQFLVGRYGMADFVRLLGRYAEGDRTEAALNSVYGLDYESLKKGVGQFVAR